MVSLYGCAGNDDEYMGPEKNRYEYEYDMGVNMRHKETWIQDINMNTYAYTMV